MSEVSSARGRAVRFSPREGGGSIERTTSSEIGLEVLHDPRDGTL